MSVFAHQLEFALAVAALFGASLRWSLRVGARGLDALLAASAAMGTLIVLWWLALGVVGLGASPIALLIAALATLAASRALRGRALSHRTSALSTPESALSTRESALSTPEGALSDLPFRVNSAAVAGGALLGAGLAFLAWCLRYPAIGADGILYHLPESLAWLHGAQPGSVVQSFYGLPVGNYPLVAELIQGWGFVLSHSFVPATLLMFWAFGLLILGGWVGLRELEVPALPRALAVAAIAVGPLALGVVNYPSTDLPATAWLVVCAALCACAVRGRAEMLAPALLAGGLAIGTKTTALPLVVVVLAVALFVLRRQLSRVVYFAGAAAAVVGLFWYARNLVDHGSPFWPLLAAPWGDPVPSVITRFNASLLKTPSYTLSGNLDEYAASLAGGVVLLAGIVIAPLIARSRAVVAAAAVALLSVLLWANAPLTGRSHDPVYASIAPGTTRYLLPGLCATALVTALASRRRGAAGWIATLLLAAGTIWSLAESAKHGLPTTPSIATFAAGAIAGAVVAAAGIAVLRRTLRASAAGPSAAGASAGAGSGSRASAAASAAGASAGAGSGSPAPAAAPGSGGGIASAGRRRTALRPRAASVAVAMASVAAILVAALALRPAASGYVGRFARVATDYAPALGTFAARPTYAKGDAEVSMAPVLFAPLAGDRLQHKLDLMPADISCAEVERRMRTGWVVIVSSVSEFTSGVYFNAGRCLAGKQPTFQVGRFTAYGGGR